VKRGLILVLVVVLVLVLALVLLRSSAPRSTINPTNGVVQPAAKSEIRVTEIPSGLPASVSNQPAPLLGETILRDYANANLPPQNDLTLMSRLMDNSRLLLKSAANRPLSANEDWADFLRGKNSAHERFLPDNHIALNSKGQLVDRWGTPLFFHALGGGRVDIRSAGPDRKLWTEDDIHRNSNGSFRRGVDLNRPGLY
jgi:hypothetical protein